LFTLDSLIVWMGIFLFAGAWTAAFMAGWSGRVVVAGILLVEGFLGLCISFYAIDPERFMLGVAQMMVAQ
jgi:hypothetical protein